MTYETTPAGTPVLTPTPEEYAAMLEREVQQTLGESVAQFVDRFTAGRVDWSNPDAFYIAGVLGLNGSGS
jgi:hypothetical protein